MACCPFKFYPCIKAFGTIKGLLAVMLIGLGVWMMVAQPVILDCNKLNTVCPSGFDELLKELNNGSTTAIGQNSSEVQLYCTCLSSCMNYFTVYAQNRYSAEPHNCYAASRAAGVPALTSDPFAWGPGYTSTTPTPTALPFGGRRLAEELSHESEEMLGWRLRLRTFNEFLDSWGLAPADSAARRLGVKGSNSLVGIAGKNTCKSCEVLQSNQNHVWLFLGTLAFSSAIGLCVSASCEIQGVKMHSRCFSLVNLCVDVSIAGSLATATIIALIAWGAARLACDPDFIDKQIKFAGAQSTDGSDNAAMFYQFLSHIYVPLAQGLCKERIPLLIYFLATALGCIAVKLSVIAVLCVCLKCSADGEDNYEHDHEARGMQGLMDGSSDAAYPTSGSYSPAYSNSYPAE